MKKGDNLRHRRVTFAHPINGRLIPGTVITHIRDGRWQIASGALPIRYQRRDLSRRITLHREEFALTATPSGDTVK